MLLLIGSLIQSSTFSLKLNARVGSLAPSTSDWLPAQIKSECFTCTFNAVNQLFTFNTSVRMLTFACSILHQCNSLPMKDVTSHTFDFGVLSIRLDFRLFLYLHLTAVAAALSHHFTLDFQHIICTGMSESLPSTD